MRPNKNNLDNLIKELIVGGWLKTPRIIESFSQIKREDFVLEEEKDLAYLNTAQPIGYQQTISQPLVVAFMLELLNPQPGETILDIGIGSGWTAALLAFLVQPAGKIIAIDIIPELVEFAQKNVEKYNFVKKGMIKFLRADGKQGYEKEAPYDKILVSASALAMPQKLFQQLKIGGKMVLALKESIVLIEKISQSDYRKQEFPGFVFVPLV